MNTQHTTQTSTFQATDAPNLRTEPAFVAPTSFQHITFTTGHSCSQPREAVATEVAARLSQVIAEALANGGWTDLKRFGEPSALHVSVSGPTLMAELYRPYENPQAAKPIVRIGISARASAGADIWMQLRSHAAGLSPGVLFNPPPQPWIGVVVDLMSALDVGDIKQFLADVAMMGWAGDFERCLAWGFVTWLESESRRM